MSNQTSKMLFTRNNAEFALIESKSGKTILVYTRLSLKMFLNFLPSIFEWLKGRSKCAKIVQVYAYIIFKI